MSINQTVISGNLTRDSELISTNGSWMLKFAVAVNDNEKNPQTGEWQQRPNFINCTMFGNRANSLAEYLKKGSKVTVQGKLRQSQWEEPDGKKRSAIEVIVQDIELAQSKQTPKSNNEGEYLAGSDIQF